MSATERDTLLSDGSVSMASNSKWSGLWTNLMALFFALTTACLLLFDRTKTQCDVKPCSPKIRDAPEVDSTKYMATQFISFTINTMGGLADKGECEGLVVDDATGSCYLGNASNMTADLEHRLQIVAKVIHTLHSDAFKEQPSIDHADHILKIVMFPEFFARGPNGAYSMGDLMEGGMLMILADEVHRLISDEEFSDYLFVFGTMIAAQSIRNTQQPWQQLDHDQVEYFNFSPVYMGGPDNDHRKFLVSKKYISTADFLDRVNLPDPAKLSDLSHRQYDEFSAGFVEVLKNRNVQLVTNNLLEFDGLRIGLEICLDHRMGALWNSLKHKENKLVDIQLIISAGMSIERGPNPIKPGGVVYLTDGESASSAACIRTDTGPFEPEHVCREAVDGVKHEPVGGPGYSNFLALSACMDVEAEYQGFFSMYQPQGCANTLSTYGIQVFDSYSEYHEYPPSLEIYPVINLP